jgi:hypothetical protein
MSSIDSDIINIHGTICFVGLKMDIQSFFLINIIFSANKEVAETYLFQFYEITYS